MQRLPIQGDVRQAVEAALGESLWFRALRGKPGGLIDRLLTSADLVSYEMGEEVISQGYPSDSLFILVRGTARVLVGRERGRRQIGRLRPPSTFGEVGLLLGEPRSATIVAEGPLLALRYGAESFHADLEGIPEFALETSRHLARRLSALTNSIPVPESDLEPEEEPAEPAPPPREAASPEEVPLTTNVPVLPQDDSY